MSEDQIGQNLIARGDDVSELSKAIPTVVAGDSDNPPDGGDCPGTVENLNSVQAVEESLNMLEISNNNPDEIQPDLDFKLEEIDISDTKECPPVVLIAGENREIRPFGNRYSIDHKVLLPAKVDKWAMVILFDENTVSDIEKGFRLYHEAEGFAERYAQVGRLRGISIGRVDKIHFVPNQPSFYRTVQTISKESLKSELHELISKLNSNLVDHALIVLPENCPGWLHGYLQYLETRDWSSLKHRGVNLSTRTSRMQYGTLKRLGIQSRDRGKINLIPQLWLKYNTKLGGLNVALKQTFDTHELRFLSESLLILSIDLCKVSANITETPEPALQGLDIIAAVGMWDVTSDKMSFRSQTRAQQNNIAAVDVDSLVRDIIESYRNRKSGSVPKQIIIFRSQSVPGKVAEIAQLELTVIKRMLATYCERINESVPSLTYLSVPKRRKISKAQEQLAKKQASSVVQTGSLVDSIMSTGPVAPVQAVGSQPGGSQTESGDSANCTRVVKVLDENELSSLEVRAMIQSLSFLSPRTTSKTRPTPIDLADLANERTRHICQGWLEDHRDQFPEFSLDMLESLNDFLTNNMGDGTYKDTLYYV